MVSNKPRYQGSAVEYELDSIIVLYACLGAITAYSNSKRFVRIFQHRDFRGGGATYDLMLMMVAIFSVLAWPVTLSTYALARATGSVYRFAKRRPYFDPMEQR